MAIIYILKLIYSGFYIITLSDKFTWIWTALDHNGDVFHKISYHISVIINKQPQYLLASKNHISQYFPLELKFRVFPRTVFPRNYHWEFPPLVFPGQPCSILWLEDGHLYLHLRTMSHTIYAAKFEQTIIHRHVHLRWESQSHAPAHVLMRLYPIDKSLVC